MTSPAGVAAQQSEAPMNLYRVTVECELYVVAEDEKGAVDEAERALGHPDGVGLLISATEPDGWIPPDWIDALPFGPNNDRTVRDWLAVDPPESEPDDDCDPTAADLEAAGQGRLL